MVDHLRNSARAVIVNDQGQVLCMKMIGGDRQWYQLPGGGQNPGESLADALKRECLEEIGAEVVVHDLAFVQDYIGWSRKDPSQHLVQFYFRCTLAEDAKPQLGTAPDENQIGFEWIELSKLNECEFYPKTLKKALLEDQKLVYLGDGD